MVPQTLIATDCTTVKMKVQMSHEHASQPFFGISDQSASQFYFTLFVLQSTLIKYMCSHSVLISFSINSHITTLICTAEALTNSVQQMEADSRNLIAAKLPDNYCATNKLHPCHYEQHSFIPT
jgi:hypothetical protein